MLLEVPGRASSPAVAYVSLYVCDFLKKSLKVLFKSLGFWTI